MNAGLALTQNRTEFAMPPTYLAGWFARLGAWDGTAKDDRDTNWFGDSFPAMSFVDGVAVMEISGVLGLRPSNIERNLGMLGYETIRGWCESAIAKKAKGAVLLIDSPGGSVIGMVETVDTVARLAAAMPTVIFTETLACSAACAIGLPAARIFTTPSAYHLSVGVKMTVADWSRFYESLGIRYHSFASGKLKDAGNPTQPLTDDHRAYFEGLVQHSADEFKQLVAMYRPNIPAELLDGRIIHGSQAVRCGVADELVAGLEEVIDRVSAGAIPTRNLSGRSATSRTGRVQAESESAEAAYQRGVSAGNIVPQQKRETISAVFSPKKL